MTPRTADLLTSIRRRTLLSFQPASWNPPSRRHIVRPGGMSLPSLKLCWKPSGKTVGIVHTRSKITEREGFMDIPMKTRKPIGASRCSGRRRLHPSSAAPPESRCETARLHRVHQRGAGARLQFWRRAAGLCAYLGPLRPPGIAAVPADGLLQHCVQHGGGGTVPLSGPPSLSSQTSASPALTSG